MKPERRPRPRGERLDAAQRRLLAGVCVLVGAVSLVPSTYNFMLNPMLAGLEASESQESLLRQLPSIAALLVIFLAGAAGGRIGERRLIFACALVFTVGCLIVAVAPELPVAVAGLVALSAATSVLAVVGLGLLGARVTNPKARATAFATFAVVAPTVFMVLPVVAGVILDHLSWRWVAVMWAVGGLVLVWGARSLFPPDGPARESAELLTPMLAGLALAAGVETIIAINHAGLASTAALVRSGLTVASAGALVICYRRSSRPSLSTAALKRGGMLVLLVVVVVVPFVNLWFYMTIDYQYVFGMSAVQTALLMVPAQLAGVLGALVSRKLIQTRGITLTGVAMLAALAVSLIASAAIFVDSPIWLIVSIMSLYAVASVGAVVPITNSIMDTAPAAEEGGASAFRGAATHIGTALGVVVMSTIVYTAVDVSLEGHGLEATQAVEISASLREGTSSEEASSEYAVPIDHVDRIDSVQKAAMIDGLHAHGLFGALFIGTAAAIFGYARRRAR